MPLTTKQIAERYGVSVRTVHRMVSRGDLAADKYPTGPTGPYLFAEADVEAAFARRQLEASP